MVLLQIYKILFCKLENATALFYFNLFPRYKIPPFVKKAPVAKKFPMSPPYNFPVRAVIPPKIIADITTSFLVLKPNIPTRTGIIKAPE